MGQWGAAGKRLLWVEKQEGIVASDKKVELEMGEARADLVHRSHNFFSITPTTFCYSLSFLGETLTS